MRSHRSNEDVRMLPESCDTMVALAGVTRHGQTLFAKNSDRPADECQPLVQRERGTHPSGELTGTQFVEVPEVGVTHRHVGSRPHWCWGYEHGFNEHQVVIGNEALPSKLEPSQKPRLIGMEILRLGLERARSASEAVDVMADAIERHGQGEFANSANVGTYDNGYIVADRHDAFVVETAGHQWAVKQVEAAVGISNVYSIELGWDRISPDARAFAVKQGWWASTEDSLNFGEAFAKSSRKEGSGAMRRARSCAVLSQRSGSLDAPTMMSLLCDHSDGTSPEEPFQTEIRPGSGICVHCPEDGRGGNTAASLVADLCADGSRLPVYWCSLYSPCVGLFFPVFIEGHLPEILSVGGATPDGRSPWWMFHRLSRLARSEPATRIPTVRGAWAPLQEELLASAYGVAADGRRLLDDGRHEEAEQLLTRHMEGAVDRVLRTVADILRGFGDAGQ